MTSSIPVVTTLASVKNGSPAREAASAYSAWWSGGVEMTSASGPQARPSSSVEKTSMPASSATVRPLREVAHAAPAHRAEPYYEDPHASRSTAL
jgi:hypothetical protein